MILLSVFVYQKINGLTDPEMLLYVSFFAGGCLYQYGLLRKIRTVLAVLVMVFITNHFLVGTIELVLWLVAFSVVYIVASVAQGKRLSFDFTYGMYIYAYPVSQCLVHYQVNSFVFYLVLVASVTLVCSMLSWHLIEKPALRFK